MRGIRQALGVVVVAAVLGVMGCGPSPSPSPTALHFAETPDITYASGVPEHLQAAVVEDPLGRSAVRPCLAAERQPDWKHLR